MQRFLSLASLGLALFLFPATSACEGPSSGDTIDFANGDRLTGTFVSATTDSVIFNSRVAGSSAFQWSDIRTIRLLGGRNIILRKRTGAKVDCGVIRLSALSVEVTDKQLSWKEANSNETKMLIEQLSSVIQAEGSTGASGKCGTAPQWGGQIGSQDSVVTGTTRQYQVGATAHVARDTGSTLAYQHRVLDVSGQASFGESFKVGGASPTRTVLYAGKLQYNLYLTESKDSFSGVYAFGVSDFYHNLSLGVNFEQAYGAGVGWQKATDKGVVYGVAGDVRYINEDIYKPGPSVDFAAAGISENFSFPISIAKDRALTIFERVIVIPAFNQDHAFQARGIAGTDLPLTKRLSAGIQFTDDYIQNSPPKSKQNYSKTALTLKYSIGAMPSTK